MMEERLKDLLHSDEQLRNTLHSKDKEKLRQKLELLQREHRRTFQRLRRAERLDSVHERIRSKITQYNNHNQINADHKPCSSAAEQNGTKEPLQGIQNQPLSPGVATAIQNTTEKKRVSPLLLSDTAYTPTSDSSQDSSLIAKASPALRLRSRRSRIRLAKRSGQSDHSCANSQEPLKETEKSTGEQVLSNAAVSHESEELFPPSEGESPSLLLPHWNLQGQVEKDEIPNTLSTCLDVERDDLQEASKSISPKNPSEFKTEKDDDDRRLLDSCTLVEGLLFPAEYYVRTTRRMAVSQSQPDMNAIILSHLKRGRPRGSRGRGRPPLKRTTSVDAGLILESYKNNSPSSCVFSNGISCSFNGGVTSTATPGRGKRGRRGRGRGRGRGRTRGHTARHKEDMKENANDTHVNDVSLASPPPKFGLTGEEAVREDALTGDACGAATGVKESEHVQVLNGHSIPSTVLQGNQSFSNSLQRNAADWASLLLPSSSQSDLPPLSPLPSVRQLKTLLSSHIHDFHLPDDQFASLKLLKLRQINAAVEQFTPYNTPARNHRILSSQPTALSLSPTPDIENFQQDISLPQGDTKLVGKVSDLKERENTGQEKIDLKSPCPDILMSVKECKNVTSSPVDEIKINILVQDGEKMLLSDDERTVLDKERNTRCTSDFTESQSEHEIVASIALSEKLSLKDKRAVNGNTDCLNIVNGITNLESHEQSDCAILPKPKSERVNDANHPTQLLLSPSLDSASCPLTLPHLGSTPFPVMTAIKSPHFSSARSPLPARRTTLEALSPPTLSPCPEMMPAESPGTPPALIFTPARRTTSAEALSPPTLSPCPASPLTAQPPSLPHTPTLHPSQDRCEAPSEPSERIEGQPEATVQEHEEANNCTYTLKSPAGGSLVDVCCVPSSSGSVWVAAAGTWAVCLWRSHGNLSSDWNLSHTWSFEEPVISVFPVPDALDLFCVTLGKLEIRQVRVLSCCSLSQTLLCDCVVQTAMGASNSRVVCSSLTSTTSIIRVFTLSDHTRAPHCLPLVSPGGALSSLAAVEGLPDALLGTDESGLLLIWNMKTGHLLQKVALGEGLSHSACLRGFSHSGVLFILMQLHSLSSVREQSEGLDTDETDRALFSLLAVNPRNGKSVVVTHLCPPNDWCGRQCEADVLGCRLVALSQRGGVCVWDLEHPREPPCPLGAPGEGEGWQLARWGGDHILLTVLHTGDVTLHWYGDSRGTPLSRQKSAR